MHSGAVPVLIGSPRVTQSLVSDLMEAEQQSSLAVSSHLQFVDRLLDLHKARLESLQQTWAKELEELSQEFSTERCCPVLCSAWAVGLTEERCGT